MKWVVYLIMQTLFIQPHLFQNGSLIHSANAETRKTTQNYEEPILLPLAPPSKALFKKSSHSWNTFIFIPELFAATPEEEAMAYLAALEAWEKHPSITSIKSKDLKEQITQLKKYVRENGTRDPEFMDHYVKLVKKVYPNQSHLPGGTHPYVKSAEDYQKAIENDDENIREKYGALVLEYTNQLASDPTFSKDHKLGNGIGRLLQGLEDYDDNLSDHYVGLLNSYKGALARSHVPSGETSPSRRSSVSSDNSGDLEEFLSQASTTSVPTDDSCDDTSTTRPLRLSSGSGSHSPSSRSDSPSPRVPHHRRQDPLLDPRLQGKPNEQDEDEETEDSTGAASPSHDSDSHVSSPKSPGKPTFHLGLSSPPRQPHHRMLPRLIIDSDDDLTGDSPTLSPSKFHFSQSGSGLLASPHLASPTHSLSLSSLSTPSSTVPHNGFSFDIHSPKSDLLGDDGSSNQEQSAGKLSPALKNVCETLSNIRYEDIPETHLSTLFMSKNDDQHKIEACDVIDGGVNECQPPGAGGHPGSLVPVEFEGRTYCGKVQDEGDLFGLKMMCEPDYYKLWGEFSIGYKALCRDGKKIRLIMENAKGDLKKALGLDIKIGKKTYDDDVVAIKKANEKKPEKAIKDKIGDQEDIDQSSTSKLLGYRVEGMMDFRKKAPFYARNKWLAKARKYYMKKNSNEYLDELLSLGSKNNDYQARYCVKNKLCKLEKQIRRNLDTFRKFRFVGASLIVYASEKDTSQCSVKFIDLSNSSFKPDEIEDNEEYVQGFLRGLTNLCTY